MYNMDINLLCQEKETTQFIVEQECCDDRVKLVK